MKILIDIGHPAHVHYFKNAAKILLRNGHNVFFTTHKKELEPYLLEKNKFRFYIIGKHFRKLIGKIFGLVIKDIRLFFICLKEKPDIYLSAGSIIASHVAFVLKKPHICFEDTFNNEQVILYKYFTKVILTEDYDHPNLGERNIKYSGYQELGYLHPLFFTPDIDIFKRLDIKPDQPFSLIRFVGWDATHDIFHKGISLTNKIRLVETLSKLNKVFISSEKTLSPELEKYSLKIPPEDIHHVIYYANLVFGESATMATEAAILGTPSIYLDNTGRLYTDDINKKYGLVFNYSESLEDQNSAIIKAIEIITKFGDKNYWREKQKKLLKDKINVTQFLVWFIENYPKSFTIMKTNPEYQNRFK